MRLNLAGDIVPQESFRDNKLNKGDESSNSAASATTEDQLTSLDTADSGSSQRLAAEAILPDSSSSVVTDVKIEPQGDLDVDECDEAPDLEEAREEALQCDDLFEGEFNFFDTNMGGECGVLPTSLRSNSSSSTMTDCSCYSKDLWAELACHMNISDGTFGSDVSNESTLTGNMEKEDEVGFENLGLEDIENVSAELTLPGSPEVEMLETSSLMKKKLSWTALLEAPFPDTSFQLLKTGGNSLDWQPGVLAKTT